MNLLILCLHSKMSASFLLQFSVSPTEGDHQDSQHCKTLNLGKHLKVLPDAFENNTFYFWKNSCLI